MELDISGNILKIKSPQTGTSESLLTIPVSGTGGEASVEPTVPVQRVEALRENASSLRELMEQLGERFNEFMRENGRELEFQVREEQGKVVIVVRQSASGEVVRTIPPEEAQRLADEVDQGGGVLLSRLA